MAIIPIACQEIVVRALLKKQWIHEDTKRIKADAFIRDPKRDPDGLSVNLASKTDIPSWLAAFSRSFGADTLHTGRIRDIDDVLDIAQTEEEAQSGSQHAVIIGLPFNDDDPDLAESLASRLVEISRSTDRTPRRR